MGAGNSGRFVSPLSGVDGRVEVVRSCDADGAMGTGKVSTMFAAITRKLFGLSGLVAWAAGLALALGAGWRPDSTPVVEDEVYWIGSAYYFHLAVLEGDLVHPDWRLLPARENPPISKFIIGAVLAAVGERVSSPDLLGSFYLLFAGVPGAWGGPEDQTKRQAVVARMTPAVREAIRVSGRVDLRAEWLRPARAAMAVCLAGASLALFLLGRALVGPWWGLLVAVTLPFHPIAAESLNHALADAPSLMLYVSAAWFLALALRSPAGGDRPDLPAFGFAALAGLIAGLACAAKMNALVLPFAAAAGLGVLVLRSFAGKSPRRDPLVCALLFAGAAAVVFVAVNPALYGDWWAGAKATVLEHRRTAEIQAGFLSGRLDSAGARLEAVGALVGFHPLAWLPLLAGAVGLLFAGSDRQRFIAGWWLVAWLAVTAWIPFHRLRYAAPLLPPTLLLVVATIDWTSDRLRRAYADTRKAASRPA